MSKKVFKTLVAVLALAAVTGPVRGETVPDVEYNLRGIPQGWTATANGNNVTVTDGKTVPIDPASPVSLTPPAADIHRVQNVTLSSITINLDEVDMTNPPVVIVCGDGDTITGSVTGDIFIILPDLQQVNLYNGSSVSTYDGYTLGKNGCNPVLPSEPYDPSITYNWCMG